MRAATALAFTFAFLLLLPMMTAPSVAAQADAPVSQTACLGPVDLLLCTSASITMSLTCKAADAGHVACDAPFAFTTEGHSTAMLPGAMTHGAGATLEWCRPGAFCQSYGVAFRIDTCSFGPLPTSCSAADSFNLFPGNIPLNPGECLDATLTGFAFADGYLVSPLLTGGRPLVEAFPQSSVSAHFCQ